MRKVKIAAAFAFACFGATWALADGFRINDGHSVAAPGEGGWRLEFRTKPGAGDAAPLASNAGRWAIDTPSIPVRDDLAGWRRRELWLPAHADCVFVSTTTSTGSRVWRPNC